MISEPMATARDSSLASDRSHEQREGSPLAREVHRIATTEEIPGFPLRRSTQLVLTSQDVFVTQAPTVIETDTHDERLRRVQQMMRQQRPARNPRLAPGKRDVQVAAQKF